MASGSRSSNRRNSYCRWRRHPSHSRNSGHFSVRCRPYMVHCRPPRRRGNRFQDRESQGVDYNGYGASVDCRLRENPSRPWIAVGSRGGPRNTINGVYAHDRSAALMAGTHIIPGYGVIDRKAWPSPPCLGMAARNA